MASARLRDLQQRLWSKQDMIHRIFEQSKKSDGQFDLTQAEVFQHMDSQAACKEKLEELHKECDDLTNDVIAQEAIEVAEEKNRKALEARRQIDTPMTHSNGSSNGQQNGGLMVKSLTELIREAYPREVKASGGIIFDREFRQAELKTLMQTTAGFLPETTRIPRIQEFAHRPIQVVDLFPVGTTDQPQIQWMEETTSTNAAVEVTEAPASPWPDSTLVYTERTVTVRKIATWLPVSDEQIADVNQIAGIIDARLRFFAMQRLDNQVMNGNGTAPNMAGILSTAGIQSQARGADPIPDAIYKAAVNVRVTGRATPSAVVVNPLDWQNVRLLRTADGIYIWAHPSVAGVMTIWGIPVVESDVIAAGTALVGDFANMSQLWTRQGVQVESGFINDDFVRGRQAIRVTVRAVLTVYRPSAFCRVTGL